jgi:hypothetical protein
MTNTADRDWPCEAFAISRLNSRNRDTQLKSILSEINPLAVGMTIAIPRE